MHGNGKMNLKGGKFQVDPMPAYPMPNSSEDSRGLPQRRQMTAEQSPQVNGSLTSSVHKGQ
jgi:hypothetical protein